MSTLEDWTAAVCADLGLDPGTADIKAVLDLARDVAHGVARPAAPLTAYLAGVAVGSGQDEQTVVRHIAQLAREWAPENSEPDGS
jgi:hypothetical protein